MCKSTGQCIRLRYSIKRGDRSKLSIDPCEKEKSVGDHQILEEVTKNSDNFYLVNICLPKESWVFLTQCKIFIFSSKKKSLSIPWVPCYEPLQSFKEANGPTVPTERSILVEGVRGPQP